MADAVGLGPSPGICTLNSLSCALTFKNPASILFSLQTLHHPWLPSNKDETCGISAQPGIASRQYCACAGPAPAGGWEGRIQAGVLP